MRRYLLDRAKDMRRSGLDAPSEWLIREGEGSPRFHELWSCWKRNGWVRRLAPTYFFEEKRWETLSEKVARINRARNPDSGVSLVRGRYRARLYHGGRETHWGTFRTKEEALEKVRKARKTL